MKTVAFDRILGKGLEHPLSVDLVADSAIVLPGRPVFIPDFAHGWSARVYVAFRISRLGKSTGTRFAPRYYDAATLALRLVPDDVDQQLRASQSCFGLEGLFDGCLALGLWMPLPLPDEAVAVEGQDFSARFTLADTAIDEAVAAMSNVATIKMGDLILPAFFDYKPAVSQGGRMTISWNGSGCLDVKLK